MSEIALKGEKMKKVFLLLLCTCLVLCMMVGCSSKGTKESNVTATKVSDGSIENPVAQNIEGVKYKSAIVIGTTNDLPSNAPYGNNNIQTAMLTNSTFSRLVAFDQNRNIIPSLAISWTNNEDSTVWTFKLRDDVYYHDGSHFTSADVKYTFDYASSTKNEGIKYPLIGYEYIDEIVLEDDYTVTFKLKVSCADWLYYAAQKIMSKTAIEKMGIEAAGCIGTGPYRFVSHESGVEWTMERFDKYWGEKPVTDRITFRVVVDNNARALALESGDVDAIFDPAPFDIVKFKKNNNYNVYRGNNLSNIFLGLNNSRIAGTDVRIRKAIAMAVNRDDIVAACYGDGIGSPSYNFINNVSPGYVPVDYIKYDVDGAKSILKELGYDEKNKLDLRLYTFSKFMPVAEVVQNNLAQANINVIIQEWAQSSFSANIKADGKYDIYVQQTSSVGGVLNIAQRFLTSKGASNVMRYNSAKFDSLYDEAVKSPSIDAMYQKYAEMQQFIAEDVPAVPIVQTYLWCVGTSNFYGIDLGDQNYTVNFTGCYVIEK